MLTMLWRAACFVGRICRSAFRPALYMATGALTVLTVVGVLFLNSKPEPSIWHHVELSEQFTVSSKIPDLNAYKALEDRLFEELQTAIYDKIPKEAKTTLNRYHKGSRVDPTSWKTNWNRTFELTTDDAPIGVLLLHGLSDSPYSLRSIAEAFHTEGAHVLGLRIPGHGTAPSGLRQATFEDWAAAVELAMVHLKAEVGDAPIFVVGYSNGGALAIHYTAEAIGGRNLPVPTGLILFSPEVGISPAARYAKVQAFLGEVLGLDRLAWTNIVPEFDPYKYGSFAVNAGVQAYRATQLVRAQLTDLEKTGLIAKMPPILAFQSAADSTVEAPVLVKELFDRLQPGGHELVIFDVNRTYEAEGLLAKPLPVERLLTGESLAYDVAIVTNKNQDTLETVLRQRAAGETQETVRDLDIKWPWDVYSLAHIALPFKSDDPIYGLGKSGSAKDGEDHLTFGKLAVHGENNTLVIPIASLTRQHWNPFYSVVEKKRTAFTSRKE